MPVARHLNLFGRRLAISEFSGEECTAVAYTPGRKLEKSHERTPVNCPHAGHRTVFTPGMANRHGLITGATGTGKTVRCKNWQSHCRKSACRCLWLCERRSDRYRAGRNGVGKTAQRLKNIGVNDWQPHANPVVVWISLARKAIRCGRRFQTWGRVAGAAVESQRCAVWRAEYHLRIADDQGLLLLDFKDLRAITSTSAITPNLSRISTEISVAIGWCHPARITVAGATRCGAFFGEPMLDIKDWMRTDANGKALSISSAPKSFIRCRNYMPPPVVDALGVV